MELDLERQISEMIPALRDKQVILSFSTGADSTACYIRLQEWGIKIAAAFYNYYIPGIPMVEKYIKYFEDLSGIHVHQFPSSLCAADLQNGLFQNPGVGDRMHRSVRVSADKKAVNECILGCFDDPVMIIGLRYSDGYFRFKTLKENGPWRDRQFNPTASMTMHETADMVRSSGIKLPFEYSFIGRSFESPRGVIANAMKTNAPKSWAHILDSFPMAKALEWQGNRMPQPPDQKTRIKIYGNLAMDGE